MLYTCLLCLKARSLRGKVVALEAKASEQDQLLSALRSSAAIEAGDPALAAVAAAHWPADARSSLAAAEAHAATLSKRVGERDARIRSLEETALMLRAQLGASTGAPPAESAQSAAKGAEGDQAAAEAPKALDSRADLGKTSKRT